MSLARVRMETRAARDAAIIVDAGQLTALRDEWRLLWNRSPSATPFQSPDWLIPWWDIFAPGELRVVTVHQNEELVGLAPMYHEAATARLLPIGLSLSDYQDILIDPAHTDVAVEAIASAIGSMPDVERCEFDELPAGGLALRLAPRGWSERLATGTACPIVHLPDSVRKLADCISPSRLRHLRTARRRVARLGDSAIIVGDKDNAVALLGELARLHGLRWQSEGQSGVFADPRVEAFHAAALPGLVEQGIARLYALTIGQSVAGVYYGLHHRDRAYAYIGGYDPDFAFESPGSVLLGHAIEEAIREGASVLDFLRGSEDYKYEWGAEDHFNVRLTLTRRGQSSGYG